MAQHPQGYGQHLGHYPPAPASFPQLHGSPSAQPPYYYSPSPAGAMPPANYATSQNAYSHNSTRIPGLGFGGAPVAPAASFPPAAPQWPAQEYHPQTNSHPMSHQQPPASLRQQPHAPYQQPQNALEEGELSEGEFEDLYEPKVLTDSSRTQLGNTHDKPPINLDSRNGSVGDADGSSIYDPHDPHVAHDESVVQATPNNLSGAEQDSPQDDEWDPALADRERSGSYSPYLSPREVHRKHSVAKAVPRDLKAADRVEYQPAHRPSPTTSAVAPRPNGTTLASSSSSSKAGPTSTSGGEPRANDLLLVRSAPEAKKKAQEAILGLWPLKVRYQDYIDEGVDTYVVKALFKDLGLDVPISKPATTHTTTSDAQPTPGKAIPSSNDSLESQSLSTHTTQAPLVNTNQSEKKEAQKKSDEAKVAEKSAAEERKDKIARKLAAMAQKTTAVQPSEQSVSAPTLAPASASTSTPASASAAAPPAAPPASVPVSAPSPYTAVLASVSNPAPTEAAVLAETKPDTPNTPLTATKTRAENNAILQQKLAALKKQQAQLAADKARAASNESTTTSSPAAVDPGPLDTNGNGDSTPETRPAASTQQSSTQQNSINETHGNPKGDGIPGLSSSLSFSQLAQGSGRTLKRPVASDFDNYTPRFEPPKRTRTDERLVIDVSDDEDVEMDMGSPTDEHPPSADSNAAPTRQSLGTFPPLSDGPNRRQRESPASSSAPTPPVHGARIDLLHKRIEETKRLIAEAEAKKAAKKATTQPSPRPLSPAAQQPSNSPKINSSNFERKRAVSLRRDRIASYELPRLTAALREKQDRLKLLFTEAARLELEVQESLDEQRKLTMEMDGLVEPSTTLSPETGEQQPQTRDGKYSGLEVQQPALPARPHAVSPHAGQSAAPNDHQDPQEELPSEPQVSHSQKTPSANVNGDAGTVPRNYEELRPAVFTETAHIMDIQMADVDASAPADDNTPVVSGVVAVSVSPKSIETSSLAESSEAQVEKNRRGTSEGISTNTAAEIDSLIKSPIPSSEPDVESSLSDVSMQQSVAELSQSDDEFYEPTPAQISNSHGAHKAEHNNTEVVDDILEEPNPNHTSADGDYQEPEDTSNEVAQGTKPPLEDLLSYKSPLSYFRAYRFHPKYFDQVPGGLKSMTFSARIDPMRPLCPYALAGEACPKGPSCEYQHFDSMVLPDGEIITQLGSADMFVGETRTRFIEGLKRVLNQLKANRVKDFDRITRAIVKHRQEFLGDKSKVLALDSSAP